MLSSILPSSPSTWRITPHAQGRQTRGDPIVHILDIPFRNQATATSCGTCCASLIIEARTGQRVSEKTLSEAYGITYGKDGTSFELMARMISDYGAGHPKTIDRISLAVIQPALARGAPIIVSVATRGRHHAIIIRGVVVFETGVAHVVVNDPGGLGMPLFSPLNTIDRAAAAGLVVEH